MVTRFPSAIVVDLLCADEGTLLGVGLEEVVRAVVAQGVEVIARVGGVHGGAREACPGLAMGSAGSPAYR